MPIVYVAGWGSGAGKSTICKLLLHYWVAHGGSPADVSYIKPVTQCEADTPVAQYCRAHGIHSVPIGPIVFRPGVTNEALASEDMLTTRAANKERVTTTLQELSTRFRLVVVDGVGYPSVGSCAGVGGADVAASCGAHVILLAPNGLGDALDTLELMVTYFRSRECKILGVVFNKVSDTARHKRAEVEPLIARYLATVFPELRLLGNIPANNTGDDIESMMCLFDAAAVLADVCTQPCCT